MVPPDSRRGFTCLAGTRDIPLGPVSAFVYGSSHPLWPDLSRSIPLVRSMIPLSWVPQPRPRNRCPPVWADSRVRSPLLTESRLISIPTGYLDVSVPRVCFHAPMNPVQDDWALTPCRVTPFGHPPDQRLLSPLPEALTQPSHVLRRLLKPRHPPNALLYFAGFPKTLENLQPLLSLLAVRYTQCSSGRHHITAAPPRIAVPTPACISGAPTS